jgi:type IV secretory pathway VirB2 component (pilin)
MTLLARLQSFVQRWAVPIALGSFFGVIIVVDPAFSQKCSEAVDIEGFNKLLGTVWGYLSGPVGKVMAIGLIVFGVANVIGRNIGLAVSSIVAAFIIAFSSDIVKTLFEKGGSGGTC